MEPRFSIILPVIRTLEMLPVAIESVLDQTKSDFELLVIGDADSIATESSLSWDDSNRITHLGGIVTIAAEQADANLLGVLQACTRFRLTFFSKLTPTDRKDEEDNSLTDAAGAVNVAMRDPRGPRSGTDNGLAYKSTTRPEAFQIYRSYVPMQRSGLQVGASASAHG
jgi:hypothetical protein